jgi:hypothetical protein
MAPVLGLTARRVDCDHFAAVWRGDVGTPAIRRQCNPGWFAANGDFGDLLLRRQIDDRKTVANLVGDVGGGCRAPLPCPHGAGNADCREQENRKKELPDLKPGSPEDPVGLRHASAAFELLLQGAKAALHEVGHRFHGGFIG